MRKRDIERLEKRNAKFALMSPKDRRIAIAKDVIKQIKAKRFIIKNSLYWKRLDKGNDIYKVINSSLNQKELKTVRCRCCAAGSIFLSGIRLFNEIEIVGACGATPEPLLNNKWFSNEQMGLIESAFEPPKASKIGFGTEISKSFYKKHKLNPRDSVVILIMKNIIKNDGIFIP